jgi:uncharacterized membrane protein
VITPVQWHPKVVHFPLALIVTAAAALLLARILRGTLAATLAMVGTWNLCLGALAALFAVGTGMAAVLDLHLAVAAKEAVSIHVKWALFTSVSLLLLAVWRGAGNAHNSRPSWLFLLVLFAATAALIETGYRGGQNVYRFGVGVERAAPSGS